MGIHAPVGKWLATGFVVAAAFVVGVLSASPAKAEAPQKSKPVPAQRGARISFNFDNIPVRSALQLIAEEGGFNLVVADSVQGNISLRLNDVTWQQALEIVLRIKGLQQRVDGDTRSFSPAG